MLIFLAAPIQQLETTGISNVKKEFAKIDNEYISFKEEKVDFENICGTVEVETQSVNKNEVDMKDMNTDEFVINPEQVQIKADATELNRRIESFISRKRDQVNALNMHGFCDYRSDNFNC